MGLSFLYGPVDPKTIALIQHFFSRRKELTQEKRSEISSKIATPLYEKWGERVEEPEKFLETIQKLAAEEDSKAVNEEVTKEKLEIWKKFEKQALLLIGRKKRLRKLTPEDIEPLIQSYRQIVADLARARSMKTDRATLKYLNHLVILGTNSCITIWK